MPYTKWATRLSAVIREVPLALYLNQKGLKRFLSVPVDQLYSEFYVEKESFQAVLRGHMKELWKNPDLYTNEYEKAAQSLIEKAKRVYRAIKGDRAILWEAYEQYYQEKIKYGFYFVSTFSIEEFIIPKLSELFPNEIIMITSPDKPFSFQIMKKELLKRSVSEVQKEFGWLNVYNYHDGDYPVSYFAEMKRDLKEYEVKDIFENLDRNKQEFTTFIATIQDQNLKRDCILAHQCAFIKTDRVDRWKRAMPYIREMLKTITNETEGWTMLEIINLTQEELKNVVLHQKYPLLKEVQLRSQKECLFNIQDSKLSFIYDKNEIQKMKQQLAPQDAPEISNLQGVIASPGKAKGKVIIVRGKHDLAKVKEGNVLIATYTIPDYTPAMKKAAAIITEEGGLTSHAAVISRELRKPCVMNIHNATKTFKDGECVEVDAEKGIVRKV